MAPAGGCRLGRRGMSEPEFNAGARLNELLQDAGMELLDLETSRRFESYRSLILRWNARTNLTSVRDAEGILARHFVESIACARSLPEGIATLLDFGSGAGFPGLPIALCRPEIAVTLAESHGKKAAFLQEAVRVVAARASVHAGRAEELRAEFDCVTLRAVDKMAEAVTAAAGLVRPGGWLALMTTSAQLPSLQTAAGAEFTWEPAVSLPGSLDRIVALGRRARISGAYLGC
jgi:16S rRNA (guanine527-N7)-methyltransferase